MDNVVANYLLVANNIDKDESLFYHPELAKRVFEEASKVARAENIEVELPELPTAQSSIKPCVYPWGFVKITIDGDIKFCYRAYNRSFHNIFKTSDFAKLWNSNKYQLIRQTVNSDKPYFKYCSICHTRTGMGKEISHVGWLQEDLFDFDKGYECPKAV
jgi:MoaA/NifB/PqqE/SkfB family radical SAM enzyme